MRLAIPPPEALDQPAGRNLLSGGLLHERGRFEPPPVGVHMLSQPGEQSAKSARGEVTAQIRKVTDGRSHQLGGKNIA